MSQQAIARHLTFAAIIFGSVILIFVKGHQLNDEQLRSNRIQNRADKILDAMPVALILCDDKGNVAKVNAEAVKMLGWAPQELIGHPLASILPQDMADRHQAAQNKLLETVKDSKDDLQITGGVLGGKVLTKDGMQITVNVRLRIISVNGHVEQIAVLAEPLEGQPQLPMIQEVEPVEPMLK